MTDDSEPTRRIARDLQKALKSQTDMLNIADPLRDMRKALGPTYEIQRGLERALAPSSELRKTLAALDGSRQSWLQASERWKDLSASLSLAKELQQANRGWLEIAKAVRHPLAETALRLKPLFDEFNRHEAVCQALERIGWLPHYTTPFDELENLGDAQAEELLERHYGEGWPDIRAAITAQLETYDIDDIAKAALLEALDNHEGGRCRSVVGLLFIEIERLVRQELHGGALDGIASVKRLQKLAGEMLPGDIAPGGAAGLRLYKKLIKHLYENVKTPDALAACAADPVPNRHAAIHGLLVYGTRQNSLNTIFMADYILQVISFGRANRAAIDEASRP